MKRLFAWLALLSLNVVPLGWAATSPIYINNSPLVGIPPQIDATAFLNRSTFDVATTLPFQAQHVLYWTNNGVMSGTPGFRFEYDSGGLQPTTKKGRKPKANSRNLQRSSGAFVNDGTISAGTFFTTFVGFAEPTPILFVNASNLLSQGRLNGTETANITLLATNGSADLSNGGIRAANSLAGFLAACDTTPFGSNYFLDTKVTELYWGAGRNNDLGTNGQPLTLTNLLGPAFALPRPFTPSHQVASRSTVSRSFLTNLVSLPGGSIFLGGSNFLFGGCSGDYTAVVFTNADFSNNPGDMTVNVVFVPTNSLIAPSNMFIDVRFDVSNFGTYGQVPAAVVEFRSVDFDIVEQRLTTNYVTLVDVTGSRTNVFLARPFLTTVGSTTRSVNTRRPSTYNFFTGRYCSFDFLQPGNSPYDQSIFINPNFNTNRFSTIYAAYSAQIGQSNSSAFTGTTLLTAGGLRQLGVDPGLSDPTNFNGRIEINANRLNINNARFKAENFISIKANDLVGNSLAMLDAPFINIDVASSQPELIITNVAPDSVSRLLGKVSAWSSAWTANVTNITAAGTNVNAIRYHVTFVDNCLQSQQPVTLHRFAVRGSNVVIQDNLAVNASFKIDAGSLTIGPSGSISLPLGTSLAFTNIEHLLNFTNNGSLNAPGAAYFGTFETGHTGPPPKKRRKKKQPPPPPPPLDNFINHGFLSGASVFVRATNVESSGLSFSPAILSGAGGVVNIVASRILITNATAVASSDLEFHANDLQIGRTLFSAGTTNNGLNQYIRGALVLDATNSFGDFETVSSNQWFVTAGVRVPTRPVNAGDLLGTRIYSTAGPLVQSPIVWAGEDRGPTVEGFENNLALGRLTLDGAMGNLFRFASATGSNAIYIDYLELLNNATNYNFALGVAPDFTIYFADANIPPEKLDQVGGGRIRWVSEFTGPQSSTNLVYPDGRTYTFNAGLVRSRDLDSDGDGIVNGEDCTPIAVPGVDTTQPCPGTGAAFAQSKALSTQDIGLTIGLAAGKQEVVLSWNAAVNATSTVEFTDSFSAGGWQLLTNFVNGGAESRVTLKDAVATPLRVYRVRVDATKP